MRDCLADVNAKLRQESTTGYLTGLANRRVFSQKSEEAPASLKASCKLYGLILRDIDNFKSVNDNCGHEAGDQVLAAIGKVLAEQMRESDDMTARLGGEEFGVLF